MKCLQCEKITDLVDSNFGLCDTCFEIAKNKFEIAFSGITGSIKISVSQDIVSLNSLALPSSNCKVKSKKQKKKYKAFLRNNHKIKKN